MKLIWLGQELIKQLHVDWLGTRLCSMGCKPEQQLISFQAGGAEQHSTAAQWAPSSASHPPASGCFTRLCKHSLQHPWIECKHPAEFQSAPGLGAVSPDLPVHKVVFVHHSQASSNLTCHPLQQHYLRVPPNVLLLIADVSFQVTLEKKLKIFISLICWVNQKNLFLIKIQLTTLLICHIYAQKNKDPQASSLHKGSYKSHLRHLILSLRVFNLII